MEYTCVSIRYHLDRAIGLLARIVGPNNTNTNGMALGCVSIFAISATTAGTKMRLPQE
jgi:hypothetical protein